MHNRPYRFLAIILSMLLAAGLAGCSSGAGTEADEETVRDKVDGLEEHYDYTKVWEMGGPEEMPLDAKAYHETWDSMVDAGWVERTLLGYPSNGDERYPVYMYRLKPNANHVDPHYQVQEGDLHERPRILVTSGFHGAEKAAPVFLQKVVSDMMTDPEFAALAVRYEWDFIPLVNPWGYSHSALKDGELTNGFINDGLEGYTVVENGEYNQGIRLNADGIDINRNWFDDSGGFPTEEARLVREVLMNNDYDLVLDMHQTQNTTACGFVSINKKPDWMDEKEYKENSRKADTAVLQAGIVTDRVISEYYGVDQLVQTTLPWDGTEKANFRNYAAGFTDGGSRKIDKHHIPKYSLCMETSIYCVDYSGDESGISFNSAANTYGNTFVHNYFKRLEDLL